MENITLIERAINGDSSAFETIFNQYWNKAYFYCLKYLRNETQAEEAAQDAFFALFRNISKLGKPQSFGAYFSRVLTNTCHNVNKSRVNKNDKMTTSIDSFVETLKEERGEFLPEKIMDQQELKDEIVFHIEMLPAKQREVMLLLCLHDLSQADIARILDVKPSVVGNRLFHARAALKSKLEGKQDKYTLSGVVPFSLITEALTEEMAVVATADIQIRLWEGIQAQLAVNGVMDSSANEMIDSFSNEGNISNPNALKSYQVVTAIVACVAVLCITILGINYYNHTRPATGKNEVVVQKDTGDILEELRVATTEEDFDEFVKRHNFNAIQIFVLSDSIYETQYRLYKQTFYDRTIFTGIRSNANGILIVYETMAPGASSPEDVVTWINEIK